VKGKFSTARLSAKLGDRGVILAAVALALLPFLWKAFHIDDTVFVRIAEHILERPLAPYAFDYNWSTVPMSVWKLNLNPPLTSYLLAAVFLPLGVSEVGAHAAFLLLAVATAGLMYELAERWCRSAVPAVLACVLSPVFLVNATNVMADIPLLFFWLLAVWFVVTAEERGEPGRLWAAGAAIACAAMCKYFGGAAAPLLALYWRLKHGRWGAHSAGFLVPFAVLGAWCLYSYRETGLVHPLLAGVYSAGVERSFSGNAAAALSFLGGGLVWPVFALAQARKLKLWSRGITLAAFAAAWWAAGSGVGEGALRLHWAVMTLGGCFLIAAAAQGVEKPDAETVLLWTWLGGTLFFAVFVNWTVNARILLPAVFPATVLAMRALDPAKTRLLWIPAAAVGLFVAAADYGWAGAVRDNARELSRSETGRVFFVGHWGFQYYMEAGGATALDYRDPGLSTGDRLVMSLNNTSQRVLPASLSGRLGPPRYVDALNPLRTATIDNFHFRAGFYSALFGPVPYLIGSAYRYDRYQIGDVR
jgi:hypothetical protein